MGKIRNIFLLIVGLAILYIIAICMGVGVNSDNEVTIPTSFELYGVTSGAIAWEGSEKYATYEAIAREFGPYNTSIGTVRPVFTALAIVVRNSTDSSVIEVESLEQMEILAKNAQWKGGDFNVNTNENGTIRISATGQFCLFKNTNFLQHIKHAVTGEKNSSEAMTIVLNLKF